MSFHKPTHTHTHSYSENHKGKLKGRKRLNEVLMRFLPRWIGSSILYATVASHATLEFSFSHGFK